ncbi:ferredoxin subunit of nitrite reductase and ring- hydroxylating dioxygenase [Halogeometricum borinquense DSM 11551]|uniref:Ferredoxin subunit of nitrite reductase and ring-hydroxylating dioxygenase n=1 Tax=Halogeometricum borinquense (strain ATCC 700274 / DSM 11551 / JCM 10706 / KCTC 4070 / PR3) TaxID=469382 RepID=E4NVY8_HALBP|nr:hypothetical protein [Halogeometricum borinquense]ADQ69208.1 ferredoxin subunit of nitrite reductase and ring- hydroxylating dioxygenase [Halogeometricum borinquense DSM 11551]ELY31511.1 ferredoxin subunit of nitrite reductase and ring- hydroxylating dioxygenase [Halogeometricum borinquense DSM 11551]
MRTEEAARQDTTELNGLPKKTGRRPESEATRETLSGDELPKRVVELEQVQGNEKRAKQNNKGLSNVQQDLCSATLGLRLMMKLMRSVSEIRPMVHRLPSGDFDGSNHCQKTKSMQVSRSLWTSEMSRQ